MNCDAYEFRNFSDQFRTLSRREIHHYRACSDSNPDPRRNLSFYHPVIYLTSTWSQRHAMLISPPLHDSFPLFTDSEFQVNEGGLTFVTQKLVVILALST